MSALYVAGISLCGLILAMVLKETHKNYAIIVSIATGLLILFFTLGKLKTIIASFSNLLSSINISYSYFLTLLKILGVVYIVEFISDLCKESGFNIIANQIQIFGKIAILFLSFPVLMALIETINKLLR